MPSFTPINALERSLRNEKIQRQINPKTFLEMVAPTPADKPKTICDKKAIFTPEQRQVYKARQTAKALEHCRKQQEFIAIWQAYNGFY